MPESQPLLTPEELAALQEDVARGNLPVDTGYNQNLPVRKHDLVAEDSRLGLNLASLDMINERFIRLFRLGMMEGLRTSPRLNPNRAQVMRFGDYLRDLRAPLSVNTVRMSPLRGYSMVVIEPNVVFSALDSFFGGFGRGVGPLPPGRMFTPTESRIISITLQLFFRSLKEAWSPIAAIELEHVSSEINPQFAQIADENEMVVLNRFESDVAGPSSGFLDMVTPYISLKPVRELLSSRVQTGDGNEESDKIWRSELEAAVRDAALEMQVVLGKVQMPLSQLETLQVGDVLHFKKPDFARATIKDIPVFNVEIGARGKQVAVRIVQAVSPE